MSETPPPFSSTTPQKSGLSTTSLILGILSLVVCSIFAGVPAIITGHIARGRAMKQPDLFGGAGTALAGLIMGYISLGLAVVMIPLLAAMLLPALAKAKSRAQTINCVSNMKQIGLAARMWANDHNGTFPPDIQSMSNELPSPVLLVCPSDNSKTKVLSWDQFSASQNLSYEFLSPNAKEADVGNQVVFRCPIHGNVGLGDGSVQQKGPSQRRR